MRFFNSKLCIFANIFNSWLTTSCSIRQMTLPYDLTHELDLGFSISNFQIAVFQELMGLPIYLNLFRDHKENDRKSCELWHGKDYKYIYVYFSSSVGHPGLLCSQTNLVSLQWRHNGSYSVSNHQPHDCLINRLIRRRSKKTLKLRVTGVLWGIHRGPVNSPHKWPVTRKMFPFDDVIMLYNTVQTELIRLEWPQRSFLIHCSLENSRWMPTAFVSSKPKA